MIKRVHRKCMMKGCHNKNSYHISLSRESGNSIIICERCARESVSMIEEYKKKVRAAEQSEPQPINAGVSDETEQAEQAEATQTPTDDESIEEDTEQAEGDGEIFKCEICGKEFKSKRGLVAHMRTHEE